jgi:hypothetical protein
VFDCDGKDETEEEDEQPSSTTSRTTAAKPKKPGEPETLEDVLEAIKDAGGLEAFEQKLQLEEEEREAAKRREEERRAEISKKTRNRLSELLARKRDEVLQELERNGVASTETETPKVELFGFEEESTEESVTLRPNRFRPEAGIRNRLRNRLNQVLKEEDLDGDDSNDFLADERTVPRRQNARPNIASIRQRNPALNPFATTTERTTSLETDLNDDRNVIPNRGLPPNALEEDNISTSSTPRTLEYVTIDRGNGNSNSNVREEEDEQFVTPLPELFDQPFEDEDQDQNDDLERPRSGLQNVRELEYVTIQRGNRPGSSEQEEQ